MKVQDENEPYDEINITPMLDLAYVCLLYTSPSPRD